MSWSRTSWLACLPLVTGVVAACENDEAAAPAVPGLDQRPINTTCVAPRRPTNDAVIRLSPVFQKLSFELPDALLQAPGDPSRMFVVEKTGRVRVFANDPNVETSSVFLDVSDIVNAKNYESGLLGMAFHPNWATNHYAYLSFTTYGGPTDLRSVVYRYESKDGGLTLDRSTETVVFGPIEQPDVIHNGGNIAFGPDGYLYLGLGDGGPGGDPGHAAQNVDLVLGKILRIDADHPDVFPPTNPFANGGGRPEIYAWGFRNPWRWSFDRESGELWVGDVGQETFEEVDHVELGGNYGWSVREGFECYASDNCPSEGLIEPIVTYRHDQGCAIAGGYVYRGAAIPDLVGTYLYGDYCSGQVNGLFFDQQGKPAPKLLNPGGPNPTIMSFGQAEDGELYVVSEDGALFKIEPAEQGADTASFPETLSDTGCVDPSNPAAPAPGLIPYTINSPLWSDGAEKDRWLALPEGAQIHVAADGDFQFPIGTVLMKTFTVAGTRVETRLFVRHTDGGWGGYSYEWNDEGTDATLLPANKTKLVGNRTWNYPSRAECMSCHTGAAGNSLGLEVAQLHRAMRYPSTGRTADQLVTLDHIGVFDAPLLATPEASFDALPRLASPHEDGTLEERARSYLHANCSSCHRPGGQGGDMDLRFTTPFAQTGTCGATPHGGDLGIAGAKIITPGDPSRSILSARVHALDAHRMPPLGSLMVDGDGTRLLDDWITQMTDCNR